MARRGMREGVAAKCAVKGVGPQHKGHNANVEGSEGARVTLHGACAGR